MPRVNKSTRSRRQHAAIWNACAARVDRKLIRLLQRSVLRRNIDTTCVSEKPTHLHSANADETFNSQQYKGVSEWVEFNAPLDTI